MDVDTAGLTDRLKRLSSSVVSDVLDECGYPGQSLSSAVKPLDPRMRLAGPALCVSGAAIGDEAQGGKGPAVSTYEIDKSVSPGAIVLIAANGHSVSSAVGGLMCLSFVHRGCGGLIVDGGVRDVPEILELGLPVFCRYATPLNAARRWQLTAIGAPIAVAGQASASVSIAPGDLVIGDADGVMAVPRAIAAEVIAWAETLAAIEEAIIRGLKAGEPREAVFAANPRFAHIRRLR